MTYRNDDQIIAFAERLLDLLNRGTFVATYKYAVLLGLIDLCLETTRRDGSPRDAFTTRELAGKVVALYWRHTVSFPGKVVLRQNVGAQAKILAEIMWTRSRLPDPSAPLHRVRIEHRDAYEDLLRRVEWTLIVMPLPKLQTVGRQREPLLYDIGWDSGIDREKRRVTAYQTGAEDSDFDNQIRLLPGVAESLVRLNGLLRPLIHREWAAMVARINRDIFEGEVSLEEFLFGAARKNLGRVRGGLAELQSCRCFYCGQPLGKQIEVDHFIPWSRYPDDSIQNLVAADKGCNGKKKNFIAASEHLARWVARSAEDTESSRGLEEISRALSWESHREETLGVARSIYMRLREGTELWLRGDEFVKADLEAVGRVLRTG